MNYRQKETFKVTGFKQVSQCTCPLQVVCSKNWGGDSSMSLSFIDPNPAQSTKIELKKCFSQMPV